ncbi:MAG: CRTAC1 family protein [Planctomycetota bacterium]|nr:CRTAC1 family protein [Planctomycetota bacterium]
MGKRILLLAIGAGLIGAGWIQLSTLFRALDWFNDVPFPPRPWTWFVAAQAGSLALGGAALAAAVTPKLRRPWFVAAALAVAVGSAVLRFPQIYPTVAFNSLHRLSYWRNGSELFLAPPEYLAWSDEFAAWLEARPAQKRLANTVFIRMGDYHLRVGNTTPAITYFEKALASVESNREEIERGSKLAYSKKRREVLRWLITANLRAGERDNCIKQLNQDACIYPLRGGGLWSLPQHALDAQRWCLEYLKEDPANPGVRYLYNVAHMAAGTWPNGVDEAYRLPLPPADGAHAMPHFTNVAYAVGVGHDSVAGGAIMDDFDGDGDLDLFATCLRQDTNCIYYRNEGDGRFTDATETAGLTGITGGLSCSQADVDNDGDLDILITRGAWLGEEGRIPNLLLRNRGDGSFEDVSMASGIGAPAWPCLVAAWCDYDLDGDLDLYVGNERVGRGNYAPSQLLQNDGSGKFTDVAKQAGVENLRYARGVCWGDYDNDGDFDLYVSNFGELNRLYRNRGDGSFEDVAEALGVANQTPDPKRQRSFQSWFFDFNNDGWLDIFSASYPLGGTGGSVDGAATSLYGEPAIEETCKLWINDGDGGFRDVTEEAGLLGTISVMGANIGDVDADGWMDFYLATGAPAFEMLVPNMMMRNVGGERVADATVASGLGHLQKGHGVAFGDVDGDGDLDLWSQLGGWYVDDRYYNGLFRNDGLAPGIHWLTLRLRGERSNRFGVGAVVKAVLLEGGIERTIYAHAGSGASFGANSLDLELGLGRATRLERLEIRWPRAGSLAERTEVLTGLPMDRLLEVSEGGTWTELPLAPIPLAPELR